MLGILNNLFNSNQRELNTLQPTVEEINSLEPGIKKLSDKQLADKTPQFKSRLEKGETLEDILPEAFAVIREAIRRTVGERAYDVQLIAGIALHQGKIAEQKTGEGKTLSAALALYLHGLTSRGCHLVTVNDYLARRDTGWYGKALDFLGLTVACICQEQKSYILDMDYTDDSQDDPRLSHLRPIERKEAYQVDVTYGTNNEFGFDYLRDNMVHDLSQRAQRGHVYAIVDEVDSILIDEARTPLIISSPAEKATDLYYKFTELVQKLVRGTDYEIDEKLRTAHLTEIGISKVERMLGVDNLYEADFATLHHVEEALRARTLFHRDKDYVVKDGQVIIVDEFTGRLMFGRRYSGGLHQAIEAKEGVEIQQETRTLATISFQNYFRMYETLAGMTATAATEAEEFYEIYGLDTLVVPTNEPVVRKDYPDVIYKTEASKYQAVVEEIEEYNNRGQPVLVGTTSIEKNELLHKFLQRKSISHEILNAKNHEREAYIIAQAGAKNSVTVATNMAGRGVDIKLGGDPKQIRNPKSEAPNEKIDWEQRYKEVKRLGGLHVIGTERHDSRRIDNQLRGRAGRQGDPGSSRFFVSLQDDLMRLFGGARVEQLMDRLGLEENVPIKHPMISKSLEQAQKRVEGFNFDNRKRVLEYDNVLNRHREIIYSLRERILSFEDNIDSKEWILKKISKYLPDADQIWKEKEEMFGENDWPKVVRAISLPVVDTLWMEHLDSLDSLRQGIGLRGYGGTKPLVAYKQEAHSLFERLNDQIWQAVSERISAVEQTPVEKQKARKLIYRKPTLESGVKEEAAALGKPVEEKKTFQPYEREGEKVGRNDPCPCGSGKKYKKCCGR